MKIEGLIWLRDIVDKLAAKHRVETDEVAEVFSGKPKFRFVEKGRRKKEALVLSARDMARKEREQYAKK